MNTRTRRLWLSLVATICPPLINATVTYAQAPEAGFQSIFDGKTLAGWHVSAKSNHSKTSGNKSGGRWVVEKGAIVGSQDIPGNGGIVITDKPFGNFEVVLEMNNDFGPDSGLFMRSTEEGAAYQAMIDYHSKGNLMGIYGERMQGKPHARNFDFGESVTEIRATNEGVPTVLPVLAGSLALLLAAWPMERTACADCWQSTRPHHLDQWCEIHGTYRHRETPSRYRRHCSAGARRRGQHQTVCSLSKHPCEAARLIHEGHKNKKQVPSAEWRVRNSI